MSTIKTYKGFDKDLKCRGFQYEIGKEYKESKASACNCGFHACEMPIEVLGYYEPGKQSRYCEVEQSGDLSRHRDDSKVASTKIKIGAEIGIPGIVKAQFEYVKDRATETNEHHSTGDGSANSATGSRSANSATGDGSANSATGYWSANSATGYCSANSATGDWSANSATGDWSANSATGYRSANSATGYRSANSATGSRSANSATGDGSANSATGYGSANSATGYRSANSATGYRSANSATGYGSANSATGYGSANSATGYGSANISTGVECSNAGMGERNISVAWGKDNKCKGSVGSFLVLSEWDDWDGEKYPLLGAKMVKVDGNRYKADTWYALKNGKVVEV